MTAIWACRCCYTGTAQHWLRKAWSYTIFYTRIFIRVYRSASVQQGPDKQSTNGDAHVTMLHHFRRRLPVKRKSSSLTHIVHDRTDRQPCIGHFCGSCSVLPWLRNATNNQCKTLCFNDWFTPVCIKMIFINVMEKVYVGQYHLRKYTYISVSVKHDF